MKPKEKKSLIFKILISIGAIVLLALILEALDAVNFEGAEPLLSPIPACAGNNLMQPNLDCRYSDMDSCKADSNCWSSPNGCTFIRGCANLSQAMCANKVQCALSNGVSGCADCKWEVRDVSCSMTGCGYDPVCILGDNPVGFCDNGKCYSDSDCTIPVAGGAGSCVADAAACESGSKAPGCYPGVKRCSADYISIETCQSGGGTTTLNRWAKTDCGVGRLCKYDPGNFPITRPSAECIICDEDGDGFVLAGRPYPCSQCSGTDCDCNDRDAAMKPAQTETICDDGKDNDCDGKIDRGGVRANLFDEFPADADPDCGEAPCIGEACGGTGEEEEIACNNEFFPMLITDTVTGSQFCGQCVTNEDCSGWEARGYLAECIKNLCKIKISIGTPIGQITLWDGRKGASRGDTSLLFSPSVDDAITRHHGKTPWDALQAMSRGDYETAKEINMVFTYETTVNALLGTFSQGPVARYGTGIDIYSLQPGAYAFGAYTDVTDKISVGAGFRPSDSAYGVNVQYKFTPNAVLQLGFASAALSQKSDYASYDYGYNDVFDRDTLVQYSNMFEPNTNAGFVLGFIWRFGGP